VRRHANRMKKRLKTVALPVESPLDGVELRAGSEEAARRGKRPFSIHPLALDAAERANPVAVAAALGVGLLLFFTLPLGPAGAFARTVPWRWCAAMMAAMLALLPPVNHAIARALDRVRRPTDRARCITAVAIAIGAAGYFVLTATSQDRDFFAKTHDECAYLIQTQMLARGKLWMPAHPMADFFDSFYILTTPKYVAITFPGSAMFFAPALWLHVPPWIVPILIAGAIVGLIYRIVTELDDGAGGLLAAVLTISLSWFRMLSIMLMSQLPALLLGLVMFWAYLRWRKATDQAQGRRLMGGKWLLLIGACSGWAALTRPVDALILTVPVGVALLIDLRRATWPRRLRSLALPILAAIPFCAVQAVVNRGVTGHFASSPSSISLGRDTPGGAYGFHAPDPSAHAQSVVRQKQLDYDLWALPFVASHRPGLILRNWWTHRLPLMADATLPARALLILLPVGLLAVRGLRWLLFATLPLFIVGYVGWAFFLEHYNVIVIPAVALLLALAIGQLRLIWRPLASAALAFTLVMALTGCWEFNRAISDEPFRATWLRQLHNTTDRNVIVLFTFDLDAASPDVVRQISQEPVYNTDVAWPDDAPVIRAHDLGPRNIELFRYYAARAPDRRVYRFSRKTGRVDDLGPVGTLVR
jgi:4-amino-4-deoxy-L-arabinose transferase-like glycosyltransferase